MKCVDSWEQVQLTKQVQLTRSSQRFEEKTIPTLEWPEINFFHQPSHSSWDFYLDHFRFSQCFQLSIVRSLAKNDPKYSNINYSQYCMSVTCYQHDFLAQLAMLSLASWQQLEASQHETITPENNKVWLCHEHGRFMQLALLLQDFWPPEHLSWIAFITMLWMYGHKTVLLAKMCFTADRQSAWLTWLCCCLT